MPKVACEKPKLPTVWLDTSVVIKFTKIARGEAISADDQERYGKLKAILLNKVREGKLLCPEGDQPEEFEGKRLAAEVYRTFDELSLGIAFTHRAGIFDCQCQHGMRAFLEKAEIIPIPLACFFRREPVHDLEERLRRDFVITAHPQTPEDLRKSAEDARAFLSEQVEKIRQENRKQGKSFQKQLDEEKRAYSETCDYLYQHNLEKAAQAAATLEDYRRIEAYLVLLAVWKRWGGHPPDRAGLTKFLDSDHFFDLPINSIKSRLYAELVTGNQTIQSGDSMDVEMLAAVIPVCHFLITDRKMETRIKNLGIDREFSTEIYSITSSGELAEKLDCL